MKGQTLPMSITQQNSQYAYDFEVDARPDLIWSYLWDINRIAACIEGYGEVHETEDNKSYQADFRKKIGPFLIRMPLEIDILELKEAALLRVRIKGSDKKLRSEAVQDIRIALTQANLPMTTSAIAANLELSGILATLGKTMVQQQFAKQIEDFINKFRKSILEKIQNG